MALLPAVAVLGVALAGAANSPSDDAPALIQAGHWKRARAILEPQVKAYPQDPQSAYLLTQVKAAFKDFDVIEGKKGKGILGDEIAELVSKNWGKYTTFAKSMEALKQKAETLESGDKKLIVSRIEILFSIMCSHPKSPAWRIRSTIGEKARWYELPETSDRDPMLHS